MSCNCGKNTQTGTSSGHPNNGDCSCELVKAKDCDGLCSLIKRKLDNNIAASQMIDTCSRTFTQDVFQWAIKQARNTSCVIKNLKNQICMLWAKTDNLDIEDSYLQCQINSLKNYLKSMAYNNVDTIGSYIVQEATAKLAVVVNKNGTFRYEWSDWASTGGAELGHGIMNGKLDFSMNTNVSGGLDYRITGITINDINYKSNNVPWNGSQPTYSILIPANGTKVWTRKGTVQQSWSETVAKHFELNLSGSIAPKSSSAKISFMTWGADWVINDKVQLQLQFVNNNTTIDLDCPDPIFNTAKDTLC